MRARRRAVAPADRRAAGDAIAQRVLAMAEFVRADRVVAHVALHDEVPTDAILDAVLASGRALLLPRVAADGLEFAAIADRVQLRAGAHGVLEPSEACNALALAPGDLVLLPGVAFDRSGRRLGRGGGHYDRAFAADGAQPFRVGIAFSFQLVASVPTGRFDRAVDAVVTETGVVRVASEPRDPTRDPG